MTKKQVEKRLEHFRNQLKGECISQDELIELQDFAARNLIPPGDMQLLEAAGVPEEFAHASEEIRLIDDKEPKFLFASEDRTWATVVTMASIVDAGTPMVSSEAKSGEGNNAVYVGRVSDDTPEGDVDLTKFRLPSVLEY